MALSSQSFGMCGTMCILSSNNDDDGDGEDDDGDERKKGLRRRKERKSDRARGISEKTEIETKERKLFIQNAQNAEF